MFYLVENNYKACRQTIHGPFNSFEDAAFFIGVLFANRAYVKPAVRVGDTWVYSDEGGYQVTWTIYKEGVL